MKNAFVLDACAVIAFLKAEKGTDVVEELLIKAKNKKTKIIMHKLNLLEVYYGIEKYEGKPKADFILSQLLNLPIRIIDTINDSLFLSASNYKCNYRISLADAIALATAKVHKSWLVTSDHHEFDIIDERKDAELFWIR